MKNLIQKYHDATGPKRWILWLVVFLGVALVILYFYWRARQQQKLLAAAYTEAEHKAIALEELRYKIHISGQQADLQKLIDDFHALSKDIKQHDLIVKKAEAEAEAAVKDVRALKTWNDLNAYNQLGRQ